MKKDEIRDLMEESRSNLHPLFQQILKPFAPPPPARVDVLCQCGWGRLGIPESAVPDNCPVCGFSFRQMKDDAEAEQDYRDVYGTRCSDACGHCGRCT